MDMAFRCPDCGHEHDEPGEALLGHQIRCLDCMLEIELTLELRQFVIRPVAA